MIKITDKLKAMMEKYSKAKDELTKVNKELTKELSELIRQDTKWIVETDESTFVPSITIRVKPSEFDLAGDYDYDLGDLLHPSIGVFVDLNIIY